MVRKARGVQAKTRHLLTRGVRERTTVNKILAVFKEGERVVIDVDPSSPKGRPFRRFQGKMGFIEGTRGRAYLVKIKDGDMEKEILVAPRHMRAI